MIQENEEYREKQIKQKTQRMEESTITHKFWQ
jgi:hypothetical protein